jgi:hypothetical protein
MGVYYFFHNITRDIPDTKNSFIAKFDSKDEEEIIEDFQSVIEANGWDEKDTIQATPDYPGYQLITYTDGIIKYIDSESSDEDFEEDYDF